MSKKTKKSIKLIRNIFLAFCILSFTFSALGISTIQKVPEITIVKPEYVEITGLFLDKTTKSFKYFILDNGDGKGVIDSNGKFIIPCTQGFDIYANEPGGIVITRQSEYSEDGEKISEKYGVFLENGTYIKPTYEDAYVFGDDTIAVKIATEKGSEKEAAWGIIDTTGKYLAQPQYTHLNMYGLCLDKNNQVVILDEKGKERLKTSYIEGYTLSKDTFAVQSDKNQKWGVIGINGEKKIEFEYDSFCRANGVDTLYETSKDEKIGLIDNTGKVILKPVFSRIVITNSGAECFKYAAGKADNGWELYDSKSKFITNIEAGCEVTNIKFNTVYVRKAEKYYAINKTTGKVIPATENNGRLGEEDENLAIINCDQFEVITKNGKKGIIDNRTGNVVLKPIYKSISCVYDDVLGIKNVANMTSKDVMLIAYDSKNKAGLFDISGKTIVKNIYDGFSNFSNGYAAVTLKKKVGFINKTGKLVVPIKYDAAKSVSEGYFAVKIGSKWGFVNNVGKTIVANKYEDLYGFVGGLSSFSLNGKSGYLDKTNKIVIPAVYDNMLGYFLNDLTLVIKAEKLSIIDKKGVSIKTTDDKIDYFEEYNNQNYADRYKGKKYADDNFNKNSVIILKTEDKLGLCLIK